MYSRAERKAFNTAIQRTRRNESRRTLETTLNPDNRTMLRVQYTKGTKDKSKDDQKMIKVLMGDEVAPRKDFITNNALDVANLDI